MAVQMRHAPHGVRSLCYNQWEKHSGKLERAYVRRPMLSTEGTYDVYHTAGDITSVRDHACVRAHAGSAESGTESHRSRDLDLPRDERPTNTRRYSVVEFTGLVQVQMSPQ